MKLIVRYLKPFALILLLCLGLLFGQAMCDLSLPNLMSDIVNVGIQQGGLPSEAPKALSEKGMQLMQRFMSEDEKKLMDESYHYIEPQSSEAERLSKEYPLAREEAICVQKEPLSEETLSKLASIYGNASYAFMLYMEEEGPKLQDAAQRMAQSQIGGGKVGGNLASPDSFNQEIPKGADGVIGSMPEGAIYSLPEGAKGETASAADSSARINDQQRGMASAAANGVPLEEGMASQSELSQNSGITLREGTLPGTETLHREEDGENAQNGQDTVSSLPQESQTGEGSSMEGNTGEKSELSFASSEEGYKNIDMTEVYAVLPLLSKMPAEGFETARQAAQSASSMMSEQVGVTFTRLFYQELGINLEEIQSAYIWNTGFKMLGIAFLGVGATVLVGFFSAQVASKVARKMRHDLFAKVESFGSGEFDKYSTASLITRTTNDVQQVQMLVVMGIRMMCYAPIMGIGGIIFAVGKSPSMSWIIAVAVLVLMGVIMVAMALALPRFKALQKLIDKLNLVSRENLSGMLVVRAFGNEQFEERRFEKANKELAETNRFVQRVMSAMMPAMMLIMNITSIVIVWVGGQAIADSAIQIGDMMAFIQYAMQIIMSFLMIAMMFIMVPRASVSAVRIGEVLATQPEVKDPEKPEEESSFRGVLEFKDVSFKYGEAEQNVLEHISFTARPGETTAFIGSTGSGKSTLINLVPRFYDVTEGSIELDGVDIRKISQETLRQQIGFVPQKGLLFSGSIQSNLKYGKEDATESELLEAVEVAQAEDFISEMEKGLETHISQGGTNVSGGQKQRLSIARALVRKAPLYIFDDSFSALDFKTDAALRRALKERTEQSTVLIVAQRVSTIMHAQQIIVLDSGKMVGMGTHKELLQSCPEYREIAESQLQKEELE